MKQQQTLEFGHEVETDMTTANHTPVQSPSPQEALAQIIGARVTQPGDFPTPIAGLGFFRRDQPSPPAVCMVEPCIVLVARGEKVYNANCAACHKADGSGAGPIKALVGSPVVLSEDKLAQIKVMLNGQNNGSMPAWKTLSDTDIAAVITYTKNNWSNKTGQVVQPAEVLALRK